MILRAQRIGKLTRESPFGTVLFGHDGGRCHGGTGATQDMTLGGYDCRWYDGGVTGQAGLVGDVLVHSYGTSSKDPVGQVLRYWMREELHGVGKVCNLCRV